MNAIDNNRIYRLKYIIAQSFFHDIYDRHYAVIKGQCLSMQAYNNPCQRNSGDIDILVPKEDLRYFEEDLRYFESVLDKNQFKSISSNHYNRIFYSTYSHQIPPYRKAITEIDMNFDILWGEYTGKRINISEFLSDTIEMEMYNCKIKTLPPLKALVQLSLHHYKDLNSIFILATRKNIKLDLFKDLFFLLKNNLNEIPIDRLYVTCANYEIIPYIYYMLYYTGFIFKDEDLDKYIEAFKTPQGEALLNCYGLDKNERHEWKYDFQTRLNCRNIYDLIKKDLTEKEFTKIKINKKVFLNE